MLVLVQRVDGDDFFEECFVYATYFLLVDFEYTTVHKTVEYGRGWQRCVAAVRLWRLLLYLVR